MGNSQHPTATMAARQPTGSLHRSAPNIARSPAAKSAKVGARRPISETWTKARPHAENSKENIGRKENTVSCPLSRVPFQASRFCSPVTETVKAKRGGDANTLGTSKTNKCKSSGSCERDTKRSVPVTEHQQSRHESVRRRIDMPTVGRCSPDDVGSKPTSPRSSDGTGSRKPTINSLFSKLGNLGEKIQLIQSQKVDLEAIQYIFVNHVFHQI